MVLTTNYATKKPACDFLFSPQCRRFLRVHKCFCSQKCHVETSRREEDMGRVKEGGEREEFFLPFPFPLSFFCPCTYPKGYYFYSPQPSTVIKSKMEATTTRTQRFHPPKIHLHCRLLFVKLLLCKTLKTIHW